jgi:biotin operon repressor
LIIDEEQYLAHYGILRKSGRYPWGSGENPNQRNKMFLDVVGDLRKEGMSDTDIAQGFGLTTTQLRAARSIARNALKQADIAMAQRLKEDRGWSNVAIGERMGINESSVRALLAPGQKDKADILEKTANMLKEQVAEKVYLDVGAGAELNLPGAPNTDQKIGISRTKLNTAIARLQEEGYGIHYVKEEQLGTGHYTRLKVLAKPDTTYSEVYKNKGKIRQISEYSEDGGRTYLGITPPVSINSKRVQVRYAEDGGNEADGVIYVRPGVDDISLGSSRYAQVRIAVDGTHFLKGMAMYKSDLPPGVDLVFNTVKSKKDSTNKLDAMKPMKDDPDNPFGSTISRQRGVMNVINEEGDWKNWSRTIAPQVLSKQSPLLAKTQLDMMFERKQNELNEIRKLTNPAVRKKLLDALADDADSSAVHLKAAHLPRQGSHVILPVNSMKPTEIYAPNFRDGERVVLIRYPHGGIFEIPELTVNNRNREARSLLSSNPQDAIGINSKVAERLSGADFDGDTVLVIPNNNSKVKTSPPLEALKNFDPTAAFPAYEGMPKMSVETKNNQMGIVSNLITDMTLQGASHSELARAVRHSMVVIDAEKKNLNYKQSAVDNGIPQLHEKYQGKKRGGAATLISRAKGQLRVENTKPRPAAEGGPIDKATGKKVFVPTGETTIDRTTGKLVPRTHISKKLAETSDAHTLSSGTAMEKLYADHSNKLKDLGDQARLASVNTKTTPYSPSAKAAYSNEVTSLNSKLNIALMNAPRERQAQIVANTVVTMKRRANPDMDRVEVRKLKGQALAEARTRTGASKERIAITPSEWDAIQAGAITNYKLTEILRNTDLEQVRKLATPRSAPTMSPVMVARAKSMAASGYTQADIADQLGVSVTTITTAIS